MLGVVFFAAFITIENSSFAGEVAVLIGQDATPLENFAARELCGYLDKLFGIQVKPAATIPSSANEIFLIGNPETNPLISKKEFPKMSDQGVVLKSVKVGNRSVVIVGGGSPRATLWAVYALAEKWGVRFLLHGDVFPAPAGRTGHRPVPSGDSALGTGKTPELFRASVSNVNVLRIPSGQWPDGTGGSPVLPITSKFKMPSLNFQEEPALRVRQWRVLNEHAMGPIAWGIADYRPVIDQLAKLRFNRLLLYIWPGQPFLPLEYQGIKQTSGTLFFGNHYPITDDMIGRSLFGNEKEFWNPDLPLPGDAEKLSKAAVKHVQVLMDYARARGMECVMPANLTEFPREFKPLLAHLNPVDMVGTPTIGPGANANLDDPVLAGLARAVLETTLKTYPGLDYIALDLPEWREWVNEYERAWKSLDAKYCINKIRSLESILTAAKNRKDYSGGAERAVKEVKADIVALYFYDKIISDPQTKIGGRKFVVSTVAEELFPILARIFPAGSETLNFVDYTPSRIVKRREVLKEIPAREIPSVLIYTLHDDNVGVLPQLATHSLAELKKDIRSHGWAGFSTRYWLIGDHDPCVAYLSRAAWDTNATPKEIYRDQITRVCGEAAVPDMLKLFSEVEAATVTLEWHGLGLTFTAPHMMMQHWTPGALSPELKSVIPHYQTALDAAHRALQKTKSPGTNSIHYWIGRLEFGIDYMNAIEAVRAAATAESNKDFPRAFTEATRAVDLIKHGLTAYANIAGDRSDKGAIAVMNEYVYRPLQAKVAELKNKSTPKFSTAP
ncbi:MAG: alpha-glucuronidase family glycosyl hydrolase [Verrucomicrobiota bacterium]